MSSSLCRSAECFILVAFLFSWKESLCHWNLLGTGTAACYCQSDIFAVQACGVGRLVTLVYLACSSQRVTSTVQVNKTWASGISFTPHEEGHSGEREHHSSGPCLPEIKLLKNEAGASEMTCLSQGETITLDSEPGGVELMLSWSNPLSIECQNRVSVEWVWGWGRGSISWLKCLRLSLFLLILSRVS